MAAPCDDGLANGAPPGACTFALAAPAGTGLPPNIHWTRQQCSKRPSVYHPTPGGTVCGQCYDITTGLANAQAIYNQLIRKSPEGRSNGAPLRPGDPATQPWPTPARFDDFWTRLCGPCERVEQEKFKRKLFDFRAGLAAPAWAKDVWNYPMNLCTCMKNVGWVGPGQAPTPATHQAPPQPPIGPVTPIDPATGVLKARYCQQDHADIIAALDTVRQTNDDWLRTLSRTKDGRLCEASATTIRRRDDDRSASYRACQCGGDADVHPHEAEVLLCLGCGNMRCLVEMGTAWSKYPAGLALRSRRTRTQTHAEGAQPRGTGSMALGRERADFLDRVDRRRRT